MSAIFSVYAFIQEWVNCIEKKLFHILNINFMSFVDLIRELSCPLSFKSFLLKLIWLILLPSIPSLRGPFSKYALLLRQPTIYPKIFGNISSFLEINFFQHLQLK